MAKFLTEREVSECMSQLSDEQQEFILQNSKQSKKAKWLEVLAKFKGIDIKENMTLVEIENYIEDWVLVDVLDSGYGKRDYNCECGMSLRYQYLVLNKTEKKTFGFGETCLSNHTSLSSELVKDIFNGFHKIDLERDEILSKFFKKDLFNLTPYLQLENIPPIIIDQVNIGLPLLDKQINHLIKLKQEHDKRKIVERIFEGLKPEAREAFEGFSESIQKELLKKMENNNYFRHLPKGFHDNEIEWFISLGLPLLDKHQKRIFLYNQKKKLEEEMKHQLEVNQYYASFNEQNIARANNQIDFPANSETKLDYQTLFDRHSDTLKTIHANTERLSSGNKKEWERIINMVNLLKVGGEFDYSSFKLNVTMICYQLHIERDNFLY